MRGERAGDALVVGWRKPKQCGGESGGDKEEEKKRREEYITSVHLLDRLRFLVDRSRSAGPEYISSFKIPT